MPLESGLQLGMKDGTVELCAMLHEPHTDQPEPFAQAVAQRLFDHQYLAMTDPAILDPDDVALASCVVSRDPLPNQLKNGLTSLGFHPQEVDAGGREQGAMLSLFSRGKQRASLDKWRTDYLRAKQISPALGSFEESLIEDVPAGRYPRIFEAGGQAVVDAFRTCFRGLIAPGLTGLRDLEKAILQERSRSKGRWVLHPAAVRGLTCFVCQCFFVESAGSFSEEDEDGATLEIETKSGNSVQTDPELRVVRFVVRGNKELLSGYLEGVVSQSGDETR